MIRRTTMRRAAPGPVAVALALVVLIGSAVVGAVPGPAAPRLRDQLGLGAKRLILGHDLESLLTSVLAANGPLELLTALVGILVAVGMVERRIGHRRTLLAYATTAIGGGALGTAAQAAGLLTHGAWSTPPADLVVFHPLTPVLGTVMAGSAFAGPLWRRRIRVLGFAGLVVVLLYSGQAGDVYRLAGALVGLALGWLLAREQPRLTWPRSAHHETRTLLAVLVAINAVGPVVALINRTGYGLLRPLGLLFRDPLPHADRLHRICAAGAGGCPHAALVTRLDSPGAVVLDVLPLVLLLVSAGGLWNGRRAAAWAALLVNAALGLLAAIYYNLVPTLVMGPGGGLRAAATGPTVQTVLAALLPLALATAVGLELRRFPVRTSRRTALAAVLGVAAVVLVGAGLYVGAALMQPRSFSPSASASGLALNLGERYVPVGFLRSLRLEEVPVTPPAAFLSDWIGPAAWAAVLVATVLCSLRVRHTRSADEAARLRELLHVGSSGSISYMATWPGSRYWFSEDERHAVAYRESSGVAVAIGEPLGPRDGALRAARAFVTDCDDRGVTAAFYAVRPDFASALGLGAPWSAVGIGEDTVLTPATFSVKGKRWQDIRSSMNRAERLGIHAVWTGWEALSPDARAQIGAISEEWIAERGLPELGFTLGGVAELQDREVKLMLALGPDERIEAVTSWLPSWRDGELVGWTLEFMRRRAGSMNGVMEFLIASVATTAQERGLEFVSLSIAPLARSGDEEEVTGPVAHLLELLGRLLEPAYGFKSLATFKAKFQPSFVPVVLAYPDSVSLPAISVALTRAYLPDVQLTAVARLLRSLRPSPAQQTPERAPAGTA